MRAITLVLILAGCTYVPGPKDAAPAAPARIEVPDHLKSCALPPKPPPIPRTSDQVAAWAAALDKNRADCAARLRRLNELIEGSQ